MTMGFAKGMPEQMMKELSDPNVKADPRILAALGDAAAIRQDHFPLAYTVAGAGLAQGNDSHARFLLLRARSMPPWEAERRSSCLATASELARRQHDADLLKQIGECRTESLDWLDAPDPARSAMGSDEITRVIQREIKERVFPATPRDYGDDEECQCPDCRAARRAMPPDIFDASCPIWRKRCRREAVRDDGTARTGSGN